MELHYIGRNFGRIKLPQYRKTKRVTKHVEIEIPKTKEFGWHKYRGELIFHPSEEELRRRVEYYFKNTYPDFKY